MAPNHAPLLEEDFAMFFDHDMDEWFLYIYTFIVIFIHIHISGHHPQAKGQ